MLDDETKERIDADIAVNVVLYMKGTPVFPQCGFCSCRWGFDPSRRSFSGDQCA